MTDPDAALAIRAVTAEDASWVRALLTERWGAPQVVTRGRLLEVDTLPGFVAERAGTRCGLLTYRVARLQLEVVTLDAVTPGQGVGTALLASAVEAAREADCRRLWLVTTNDNLPALRFYQRRGLVLSALYRGALELARKLKPTLPEVGLESIPLRDELELELLLR